MRFILLLLLSFSCFGIQTETGILSRIEGHIALKDYASAVFEAEKGLKQFPNSEKLFSTYLLSLLENGQEQKALSLFRKEDQKPFLSNESFLEKFSWAILKSGTSSTNYPNRLLSLLTAGYSKDARSTSILLQMLKDDSALLRATAVRLSAQFQDAALKDEIFRLLKEETNWRVRLEVLGAIGNLKEKRSLHFLKNVLEDKKALLEEKLAAISSLVALTDTVEKKSLLKLFKSDRATLRMLGIQLALYFEVKEVKDEIIKLIKDPISSVRMCALYAFGMHFRQYETPKDVLHLLQIAAKDADPKVAILSSWSLLFVDHDIGYETLFPFFVHEKEDVRLFAAAALSHSGKYGISLMEKIFDHTHDKMIKLNLCLGLVGQRKKIPECKKLLYQYLMEEEELLMFSTQAFFKVLMPSKVRYTPLTPNYPQAIDQVIRLELLSLLSILEDPRAIDAARHFLKQKDWQVKGALAVLLLREGEEDAHAILQKLLADKDPEVQLRAALIIALLTKDESVIHSLHAFYWKADYLKKIDILEAIGHIGSKDSLAFLTIALKDPSQKIRLVAASSIIRCLNH